MARHEAEWFTDPVCPALVAGSLSEATRAESVLTERGVDYAIVLDRFGKESLLGAVFGGTYHGLFFMCLQDCIIPQRAFWRKLDFTISCP